MQPSTHLTSMIYESGKSLSINNLPLVLNNDFSYPLDVMMLETTETGYETQEAQVWCLFHMIFLSYLKVLHWL